MSADSSSLGSLGEVIAAVSQPRGAFHVLAPTPRRGPARTLPPLVAPARHPYYELVICQAGRANIVAETTVYRLRRGDALVIMPGAWHYESYQTVRQSYQLCWLIEFPRAMGVTGSAYSRGTFTVGEGAQAPMLEQHAVLAELAQEARQQPPHWQIKARALLLGLLVEIDRRLRHAPTAGPVHELDPVWRLVRLIETRFREPLQLKTLAGEVGLSEDYLSRRFRATYRTTFKRYLQTIRIHHAQWLLRSGWTVKAAAAESGFSDEYYFNRVFKQHMRTTPGRFRQAARASAPRETGRRAGRPGCRG